MATIHVLLWGSSNLQTPASISWFLILLGAFFHCWLAVLTYTLNSRLRSKVRRAALGLFDPSRQEEISEEVLRDAAYFFRYHIHRNVFGWVL